MNKKILSIVLVLLGILLLIASLTLVYREWAPSDDSAATVYYLSPTGNDLTGNGSANSPWQTLTKADATVSPGDTVILKDGTYPAYIGLTKSNITWRAENKHKAVLDGGFAPSMLDDNWNNIVSLWNTKCSNKGMYEALLGIRDADNVTIDGLFLRNSCGRGISVSTSNASETVNNVLITNTMIDWTTSAGIYAEPHFDQKDSFQTKMNSFQFIDNVMTRTSIGDEYNVRVAGACQPKDTPPSEQVKKYCVNISAAFGGINTVIRGNIIAWGEGEIAPQPASKGLLFENNIVVGNKNSFYTGMVQDAIVRNNLFYAPENKKPRAGGDEDAEATGFWRFGMRNESGHLKSATVMNTNISFYNNLIVNMGFFITGTNNGYIGDNFEVYFGNNTLVAGKELDALLHIQHGAMSGGDGRLTGIMENNIFDRRKNPTAKIEVTLSSNDNFTLRNNLWPENIDQEAKGPGDVYANDPGLMNSLSELTIQYPNIGPDNIDITELRNAVDINNYRLKQNSVAINSGSTGGGENGTSIPQLARSQDYLKNTRIGIPDIGAIEYGGVFHSTTPTPTGTPGASLTPTLTRTPGPTLTPTEPITGNVCGKADIDNNGIFDISDFAGFAQAYGDGRKSCGDSLVDYGPCRGRDADRNGNLDINDFGGYQIGFAQRYYPRTSCAL